MEIIPNIPIIKGKNERKKQMENVNAPVKSESSFWLSFRLIFDLTKKLYCKKNLTRIWKWTLFIPCSSDFLRLFLFKILFSFFSLIILRLRINCKRPGSLYWSALIIPNTNIKCIQFVSHSLLAQAAFDNAYWGASHYFFFASALLG